MASILSNKELVSEAVNSSSSIKEVLHKLNLRSAGGNYAALKKACEAFSLNLPSYNYGRKSNLRTDEEVFVLNSDYNNRTLLKKRLFKLGFENKCSCGQGPEWKGKKLTLTLEHKNGIWNDNRIENLEILCPNCHSQTETFSGKKTSAATHKCLDCNKTVSKKSTRCSKCEQKNRQKKIYPEIEELISSVSKYGYKRTAEGINVSDNAIRKHFKKLNINPKTLLPFN